MFAMGVAGCQLFADIQDLQLTPSSSSSSSGQPACDIPAGGTVLLAERFDDTDFTSRGWYDGAAGMLSSDAAPGSGSAFQCDVAVGNGGCTAGRPSRLKITPTTTVYLAFYARLSDNWQGAMTVFSLLTNLEDDFKGPGATKLTAEVNVDSGTASLRLADVENVDTNCLLLNDGSFQGCNGDFDSYVFTEARSVAACNGLLGDVEGHECSTSDNISWWSSRTWSSDAFSDSAGPAYKGDWRFVEVYFEMNGFESGKGVPNGKIRWLSDGAPIVCSDHVLFRTGDHTAMEFSQLIALLYMGGGPAESQTLWLDDLVVATARP